MPGELTVPPPHVRCRQFLLANLTPGMTVLDVGCGEGSLMTELAARGCAVEGVEIDRSIVQKCVAAGLRVREGRAENLPIPDASVDAIVCSVVIPYTDERRAVAEWARVLKPGGAVNASYHGLGYGLDYLLHAQRLKVRLYGFRMLTNTLVYGVVGRRLPRPWGDTLCQVSRRMAAHYRAAGLRLDRELLVDAVLGLPRFLCHRVIKVPANSRS